MSAEYMMSKLKIFNRQCSTLFKLIHHCGNRQWFYISGGYRNGRAIDWRRHSQCSWWRYCIMTSSQTTVRNRWIGLIGQPLDTGFMNKYSSWWRNILHHEWNTYYTLIIFYCCFTLTFDQKYSQMRGLKCDLLILRNEDFLFCATL